MTALALSRIHFPVTTLGPGSRVGVWFQGCSIRCPGCVSMDTWDPSRGLTTVEAVLNAMAAFAADADGLTVSGGEPFDQPEALHALLRGWGTLNGGDVLVYSGRPLEELEVRIAELDGLVDAVIADRFEHGAPGTLALRGSDNQRLVTPTARGAGLFRPYDRPRNPGERAFDVMFDDASGEVFLAGIPSPGDMSRLADILGAAGHSVATTQDRRAP